MTDRGARLLETTTRQITELSDLLSTSGDGILALPCPGRVRLGDGTVGAIASHTADSYRRIASFLQATVEGRSSSETASHDMNHPTPNVDLNDLLDRLRDALNALRPLGELTDQQLDAVPPASDMKFCDGRRTLEQTLISLLKHQRHQIDAMKAAVP